MVYHVLYYFDLKLLIPVKVRSTVERKEERGQTMKIIMTSSRQSKYNYLIFMLEKSGWIYNFRSRYLLDQIINSL